MMRIKLTILLLLLFGAMGQFSAADLPRISLRESVTVWWNSGWGDKFYFHTLSLEEYLRGGPLDFDKTLRHTTGLNAELWCTPANLSSDWPLSFVGKYRHLSFNLADTINFSFEHSVKSLEADLNFLSAGVRLGHKLWIVDVYGGFDVGHCFGSLTTDQFLESPQVFSYHVQVDGDGGGPFFEFLLGGRTEPLWTTLVETPLFAEIGFRTTTSWDSFDADEITVNEDQGYVVPAIKDGLIEEDRQIAKLEGVFVSVGIEFKVF
ncbi:MAG: hypothetical protein ABIJ61_11000 [bacterium]